MWVAVSVSASTNLSNATSKVGSQSLLTSTADSKSLSNSVVTSTLQTTSDSKIASQSLLTSSADSKASSCSLNTSTVLSRCVSRSGC